MEWMNDCLYYATYYAVAKVIQITNNNTFTKVALGYFLNEKYSFNFGKKEGPLTAQVFLINSIQVRL